MSLITVGIPATQNSQGYNSKYISRPAFYILVDSCMPHDSAQRARAGDMPVPPPDASGAPRGFSLVAGGQEHRRVQGEISAPDPRRVAGRVAERGAERAVVVSRPQLPPVVVPPAVGASVVAVVGRPDQERRERPLVHVEQLAVRLSGVDPAKVHVGLHGWVMHG